MPCCGASGTPASCDGATGFVMPHYTTIHVAVGDQDPSDGLYLNTTTNTVHRKA